MREFVERLHVQRGLNADFFRRNRWPGVWQWYCGEADPARRARYNARAAWTARVSRALADQAIAHIFLKGVPAEELFYGGQGLRKMADIDLLVARDDVVAVNAIFDALGFDRGIVVAGKGFRRLTRAEEVMRSLHSHEAVPRILYPEDELRRIEFDINFAFTWKVVPHTATVQSVIAEAVSLLLPDGPIPILPRTVMGLHTMVHAYAEAMMFLCTSKTWTADKVRHDSFRLDNIYEAGRLQAGVEAEIDALAARYDLREAVAYVRGVLQYFATGDYNRADVDYFKDPQGRRWSWRTNFAGRIVSEESRQQEVQEILAAGQPS